MSACLHHRVSYYCVKDGADFTVMSELMTAEADLGINTYSTAVWANTAQTKHTATPGMKVSRAMQVQCREWPMLDLTLLSPDTLCMLGCWACGDHAVCTP
jgi:hypothetical protein